MSFHYTELTDSPTEVLANKTVFSTSEDSYRKVYVSQLFEVLKLAVSFLLSQLVIKLFDNAILEYFKPYKTLYSILLIFMLFFILVLATSIFTYVKITNEKDAFLQSVYNK